MIDAATSPEPLTRKPAVDADAASRIGADQATRLRAVPFAIQSGVLHVAMLEPNDLDAIDEIAITADLPVQGILCEQELLGELLREHFGTT
ncbi:MAG: hypothetical protein AAGB34_09970, partial [Planctomycetota bacterium]